MGGGVEWTGLPSERINERTGTDSVKHFRGWRPRLRNPPHFIFISIHRVGFQMSCAKGHADLPEEEDSTGELDRVLNGKDGEQGELERLCESYGL